MLRKILVVWACLSVTAVHAVQVYVCTNNEGEQSFQQLPCESEVESEVRVIEPVELIGSVSPASSQFYEEARSFNARAQLKHDVRRVESRISQYQRNMQKELDVLLRKKRSANNNLAGAQWETSISNEMQATTSKYQSLISIEQNRLNALREQSSLDK